jgi:hypothetical protein
MTNRTCLAADISGTVSEFMLASLKRTLSKKLLTTHDRPDAAVIEGTRRSPWPGLNRPSLDHQVCPHVHQVKLRVWSKFPRTSCSGSTGSTRASAAPRKSARIDAVRGRNDPLAKPEDDDKVRIPPISPLNLMPMRSRRTMT